MSETNWNSLTFKSKLSFIVCIIAFLGGMTLTFLGFFAPPTGDISGGVISCFGMLLTFVGSILGISQHYSVELEKIKAEVSNNKKEVIED